MDLPPFPHVTEVIVRGYELDSFGHANNASYLNWLEHARWELFREYGILERMDGAFTMLRHMELDFKAETFHGDRLRIATWPRTAGDTSILLGASIRITDSNETERIGKVALTSTSVLVCMKKGVGKVAVPESVRELFPEEDPGEEADRG